MREIINQFIGAIVISVVSILVGWMMSALKMTSRIEFSRRMSEINDKLKQIENEQKSFVTHAEFRNTMQDLKDSLEKQHDQLRDQLNQINATLLSRRGPTQG